MFKKNRRHLQIPLTSHVDELPEKLRTRLKKSWAEVFYQQFFCRLNGWAFEVLYADLPSRPNARECTGWSGIPESRYGLDR